jgi:GAF domain-containing protein
MSFTEIQGNVIKAIEIRGGNSPPVRTVFPLDGEGIIAKVARTGKTINISDIRDDPDYFEAVASTRSELTVPINVDGKIVAVINIESSEANAFSSEDQRLVEIFSEQIASAMRWLTQLERVQSSEEKERESGAAHAFLGGSKVYNERRFK